MADYPSAPNWFKQAVAQPSAQHIDRFRGMNAAYRTWGPRNLPALILVHGGCAHSHWWDFIAPQFSDDFFVVAVDLIGMGDSDHLARHSTPYNAALFADQLDSMCEDARIQDAILLGHSMGGRVCLQAAARNPGLFRFLIVADARVRPPERLQPHERMPAIRAHKIYADLETAVERFRLLPPQACENDFIVEYIARHSLREVDDGWQWKFDRRLIDQDSGPVDMTSQLREVADRMALIYGENSALFNDETLAYMKKVTGDLPPFVALEGAQHHLFLDKPLEFVAQVRQLISLGISSQG